MLGGNSFRVRPENSKQCASETRSGAMTGHAKLFRTAAISSKFRVLIVTAVGIRQTLSLNG